MTENEFYNKIDEWIREEDLSLWSHMTLLAYFCFRYEKLNQVKFKLVRSNKGVAMTKESSDMAKLFRNMAPEDYKEYAPEIKKQIRAEVNLKIKNYINWLFDWKFKQQSNKINGTHLLLSPSITNEFERMYAAYLNKNKSSNKIDLLLTWCHNQAKEIFDNHTLESEKDLLFIKQYVEKYNLSENDIESKVVSKAKELGLI